MQHKSGVPHKFGCPIAFCTHLANDKNDKNTLENDKLWDSPSHKVQTNHASQ